MSGVNAFPPGGPAPAQGYGMPQTFPTTSGLAVGSLICALMICVPFLAPVLAVGLGIGALISVSRSDGRKKGGGLAAAGIAIGSLVFLADAGAAFGIFGIALPLLQGGAGQVKTFVNHVEARENTEARAMMSAAAAKKANAGSLEELRVLLERQFGKIQSVSFDWASNAYQRGVTPGPQTGSPFALAARANQRGAYASASGGIPLPFKAVFDKQVVYGIITFGAGSQAAVAGPSAQAAMSRFGIDSITVVGPKGPWTFPFNTSSAPASDESESSDESSDESDKSTDEGT